MIEYFKNASRVEKTMLLVILALFVPIVPSCIIMAIAVAICLKNRYIQEAYHEIRWSHLVWVFTVLELLVSAFYHNWPGMGATLGILMFFTFAMVFRTHMTKEFFHHMTTLIMVLSLFAAAYGLVEYMHILNEYNIDTFMIVLFNTPMHRINSFYFNSNYYAMMINFFIGITFYRLLKQIEESIDVKRIIGMVIIIVINLFLLYLTACRTAIPALGLGLIVMLLVAHHYKLFSLIAALSAALAGVIATHPQLISRFSNIHKYIGVRRLIWKVALENIRSHPLFGEGPMTYWHIYHEYPGAHATQHAHNIFIDPVLCFGVVGLCVIASYFIASAQRLYHLAKLHLNDTLVGLIIGFMVMTLIHGFLDYTIFFVHTATLFLIIIGSFDIYRDEINKSMKA